MSPGGLDRVWKRLLGVAACAAVALIAGSSPLAQQAELVIHNGLIVTAEGRMEADVRIRGEKIAEIGRNLTAATGAREIDAKGMLLLPGAVDTHTHLNAEMPNPPRPNANTDDYISGSSAALAGGATTITNFIPMQMGEDASAYADRVIGQVQKTGIADFYIHLNMGNDPTPFVDGTLLNKIADRGIVSTGEDFLARVSFDQNALGWYKVFKASGKAGVLSMLHCEDASILAEAQESLMAEGKGSIHNFSMSAPAIAEVVAVQRAVAIAEATGAPIYILHTSSGRALKVAEDAMRRGLPVYVETRPMYLHLTSDVYQREDAGLFLGGPPLREKWDQDMLWEGIAKGTVHTIGTDHTGFSKQSKLDPTQTMANKRMGLNNLQDYLPMMFSDGVVKGRITLEQFVAVTSTNAAKLMGLYPRKGTIQAGSDADIVIWNPTLKKPIRDEDQFSNAKYSTYAGWEITGWPKTTIRRGEIVYDNGKILAKPGSGKFIPAARFQRPQLRQMAWD
jgi:dihydropyrimidinase